MTNKTQTPKRRDSQGKFVSSNTTTQSATPTLRRDAQGRFASANSKNVKSVTAVKNSSFIKNMKIVGLNVEVVTQRSPLTVYTYRPTSAGLSAVKKAITNGTSLGHAYNSFLRGKEISRTIYKS